MILKQFYKAIQASLVISVFLILFNLILGGAKPTFESIKWMFVYCMLYGMSLYTANTILFILLNRIFATKKYSAMRIITGIVSSVVVSTFVIFLLHAFEIVVIQKKSFNYFINQESPSDYVFTLIITIIVTLTVHLIYFYQAYNKDKIKEQKIIARTANAQFETLKNQIDPHFLFNSLNVLSSLIEENPDSAQRFTTSLSKIYRYVLEQKDKELVTVQEELVFAKTYMDLLKMRFENSISYELPQDFNNPEAKVVPLSLQLLLENTIKHNIVSEKKPLHIKIYVDGNNLVIENNLQKKEVLQERKGVGLQNIVDRYALLSQRNVIVEETKENFKVKIPILTKQIAVMETQNIYNENTAYLMAKDRVEKLKSFYGNLISYCIVIPVLIIINLNTSNYQWFWYPMLGWGLGVTFHALETFGFGKSWEERKIQQLLENEDKQNSNWN